MFELDLRTIGGTDRYYFHPGTDTNGQSVVWQGVQYEPFPIEADGFEMSAKGTLPRPTLRVSNITGMITPMLIDWDDLVGAKVIRRRTFARYLDGQPTEDPTQHLPDDIFYVERKVNANRIAVEFELSSAMDLSGVQLPGREIRVGMCGSEYRGGECPYAGTNYFDVNDQPVGTLAEDVCSKRVSGCKVRFGAKNPLPYGGFPAGRAYRY